MTKDEALKLIESKFWEDMNHFERAMFQLHEDRLCMPWDVFQEAMENALGRSVWTHEIAMNREGLKKELVGQAEAPTMEDIINLIPEDKQVLVSVDTKENDREKDTD